MKVIGIPAKRPEAEQALTMQEPATAPAPAPKPKKTPAKKTKK